MKRTNPSAFSLELVIFALAALAFAADIAPEAASAAPPAEQRADAVKHSPENLAAAVRIAISLLREKKASEFLERFELPAHVAELKKGGRWEKSVKEFSGAKAAKLLADLKAVDGEAKSSPPEGTDGSEATLNSSSEDEDIDAHVVHFAKAGGKWYITENRLLP
jgi:hypothetical protein